MSVQTNNTDHKQVQGTDQQTAAMATQLQTKKKTQQHHETNEEEKEIRQDENYCQTNSKMTKCTSNERLPHKHNKSQTTADYQPNKVKLHLLKKTTAMNIKFRIGKRERE